MGPRAFARGDVVDFHRSGFHPEPLQWGRELSPAEIRNPPVAVLLFRFASMGPRAFARGDDNSEAVCSRARIASMGPRAFARGDLALRRWFAVTSPSFNGAASFRPRRY